MSLPRLLLPIIAILLVGAGCATQTPAPQVELTDPNAAVVIKKPDMPDPNEAAYKYCEKDGNHIVVQFNSQTKQSRAYCVFSNNTACDANMYLSGTCGPNNGANVFTSSKDNTTSLVRACNSDDPVVCGSDGKNYTNRCVAELQHIAILHDGLCTAAEQADDIEPSNTEKIPTKTGAGTSKTGDTATSATVASDDWLPLLYQMARASGKQIPAASVDKCIDGSVTSYYFQDGGVSPFSVLYNDKGNVICFPSNDITHACPNIILEKKASVCKQIWKDLR